MLSIFSLTLYMVIAGLARRRVNKTLEELESES